MPRNVRIIRLLAWLCRLFHRSTRRRFSIRFLLKIICLLFLLFLLLISFLPSPTTYEGKFIYSTIQDIFLLL
jgi:hypothetical protein